MTDYYLILPNGKKITIKDEEIGEELHYANYKVGLYHKEIKMKKMYLVTFQRRDHTNSAKPEYEYVAEKVYVEHYPLAEELQLEMTKLGLGLYDIVTIQEGFVMDWEYNDD